MKKQKPISDDSKAEYPGCLRLFKALFGSAFLIGGLVLFYSGGLKPYLQKQQSDNWPTAECQIKKADMKTHKSEDSTSYSIDWYYTFEVDGRVYSGDRYSFSDHLEVHSEAKRQQANFPAGTSRQCFYNPHDPSDCVLDRTNQNQGWMPIFGPFIFVTIGGLIVCSALFGSRKNDETSNAEAVKSKHVKASGSLGGTLISNVDSALVVPLGGVNTAIDHPEDQLDAQWSGPLKLKPEGSRWVHLAAAVIFALVWNGFLALFFFDVFCVLPNFGWAQTGVGLLMAPFAVVGLLAIAGVIYFAGVIFNPTIGIVLSSGAVPLGGVVDVAWQVEGRFERIKKLTIHVQAFQHATYERGTDTKTDVEVFEKLLVTEATDVADVAFGNTSITIPAKSMHTFDAKRNKIKWQVTVHGEISWAPDIVENYEFRVTPVKTESRIS